ARSLDIIRTAAAFLVDRGRPQPFGAVVPGLAPLPEAQRRERAGALFPLVRGLVSTDRPQVGHYTDSEVVLDFLARAEHPRLAALGTSCPDHFLRTKVRPLVLDLPADAPLSTVATRLAEAHAAYREDYRAYYQRHATPDSPPMRGADPAIVLVPGVGMFSFGATSQTACVGIADRDAEAAAAVAADLGSTDVAVPVTVDVTDEAQIAAALRVAVLAFGGVDLVVNNAGLSISRPLLETSTADWDVQHDVMARGSFLVSREAARILIEQGMGGDIIY